MAAYRPPAIDPLAVFQRAVSLHQQGRLWDAEQLYVCVTELDRRHFDALLRLGIVRLQQRQFAQAVSPLRRAVRVNSNSSDAHHSLACALTGVGAGEEAVRHYEASLKLRSDFAEAHNNLGHQLQVLGRCEDAIAQYQRALAIQPNYAEARNNLGNALHLLDRSDEAIGHYREALAIRPDNAEAHFNMAVALRSLGQNEEAIFHFEKAIAIRPNYAEARNSLGNAFDAVHRHEEAIEQYEKAIAIRPDYPDAHINLGIVFWALGRQEEALLHYQRVLAINPNYVETLKNRGDALTVLLALTHLPESVLSIDALAEIEKLVRRGGPQQAEFENLAGFVRAKLLDKANRHAEAWQEFASANRTMFLASRDKFVEMSARQAANYQRLRDPAELPKTGMIEEGHAVSLFILGPSRSGKTSMERLVSMLDRVKRGYEDGIVEETVHRACETIGLPSTIWLEDLPRLVHPLCRKLYTEELARRAGSAKIVTNTHPIHIHNADLLATTFPNARFLCIKRNVEDNVLRIYMRKYCSANVYSYDLKAARDHVLWYQQMIDLLEQKLPEIVRVIQYEDMVANPSAALVTAAHLCSVHLSRKPLPSIGNDIGCAAPYRMLMAAELSG